MAQQKEKQAKSAKPAQAKPAQAKPAQSKPGQVKPVQAAKKRQKVDPKVKGKMDWYPKAEVICVCGNSFVTGSTLSSIKLDICNVCHPFYTGKQKLVDVEGRVERFQKRYAQFNKAKSKEEK